MICPTCKSSMIVVEHKKIELDYCPECHGVWFDSGELELFLDSFNLENRDKFLARILSAAEVKTAEKKRRCPICSQKMKKVHIGGKPNILIDVCLGSDGLWFDGGEVGELIKQLAKKPSKKGGSHQQVEAFLGEVFKARE
jgi:Zn-finger nucleic acid-binding protein